MVGRSVACFLFPPVARADSAPRDRAGVCENRFGSIGAMRRVSTRDLRVLREELSLGHVVPHLQPREQRTLKLLKPTKRAILISKGPDRRQMTSVSETLCPEAPEVAQWRATSSRTGCSSPFAIPWFRQSSVPLTFFSQPPSCRYSVFLRFRIA